MAILRPATHEQRVTQAFDTAVRARQHADGARAQLRGVLYKASQGGVSTTRLAELCRTSWSRMDQQLKRAASEARTVK